MYYNIKTNKIVEEGTLLGNFTKRQKENRIAPDVTFQQYLDSLLVTNGGTFMKADVIDTRPDVLIRKYAEEIGVHLKGRVHIIKQTHNGLLNLYEDKAGSQFWLDRVTGKISTKTLCAAQCF